LPSSVRGSLPKRFWGARHIHIAVMCQMSIRETMWEG
jgi:hypothetical protein